MILFRKAVSRKRKIHEKNGNCWRKDRKSKKKTEIWEGKKAETITPVWHSRSRIIQNSSRNWSTMTSLMTSFDIVQFISTSWLSTISNLVNIRCKLIKILCLQAQIYYFSRNRRTMTSLMTSSWRRSIGFVTTCIPSTMRSLVKIGWKMVELSCSQARGYILPEMTSLMTSW